MVEHHGRVRTVRYVPYGRMMPSTLRRPWRKDPVAWLIAIAAACFCIWMAAHILGTGQAVSLENVGQRYLPGNAESGHVCLFFNLNTSINEVSKTLALLPERSLITILTET